MGGKFETCKGHTDLSKLCSSVSATLSNILKWASCISTRIQGLGEMRLWVIVIRYDPAGKRGQLLR